MVNTARITRILGWLLIVLAVSMAVPLLVSLIYAEGDTPPLAYAALCTLVLGGGMAFMPKFRRQKGELTIKEGFVIVTAGWVLMSLCGALPFWFSGQFPGLLDSIFESVSGFSTTGSSILQAPADLTRGIAYWRMFMQWIGGLGIVLFGLAILPMLGVGGMHLYKAETPGPSSEKLTPRLKDTAKLLWRIYAVLTLAEMLLLWVGGMDFYDASAHAFTTMATGGFSTRNASIAAWQSPVIHTTIAFFMFLAGVNFTLYFRILKGKGSEIFKDGELRLYLGLTIFAVVVFALIQHFHAGESLGTALDQAFFTTTSIMTTTGFGTADFNLWHPFSRMLLLGLMVIGGMAGSTAGGLKMVRLSVLVSLGRQCLRRMLHPRAVFPVRVGDRAISPDLVNSITGFLVLYLGICAFTMILLGALGLNLETSISATIACLSNIGPGLDSVGPTGNFAHIPALGKVALMVCMLLGRLEIYTVLVIFGRDFWKK